MKTLQNDRFEILLDEKTGGIAAIFDTHDPHRMNVCGDLAPWGVPRSRFYENPYNPAPAADFSLVSFETDGRTALSVYENSRLRVDVRRAFTAAGRFAERFTVTNLSPAPFCLCRDTFAITLATNDRYTTADDCLTNRLHTHLWCGLDVSWVCALRMGDTGSNLGLVMTEGALVSYSQNGCKTNVRGYFLLEPDTVILPPHGKAVLSWELFFHDGKADFLRKLRAYPRTVLIDAARFTVFEGESIDFAVDTGDKGTPAVTLGGAPVEVHEKDGRYAVSYKPSRTGEHRFEITANGVKTYALFNVKTPFAALVKKRLDFIAARQQYREDGSPLDGAYLIYDNTVDRPYFDYYITDHNACRERMNMPLALAAYLRRVKDPALLASLERFVVFLYREFYDDATGEVFNNIGKNRDYLRLYNAPGVMLFLAELYPITKNEKYLDDILRLAQTYYRVGGEKCYSNAIAIRKVLAAFHEAKRYGDEKKMLAFFENHVRVMTRNGASYPPHEVNYEQTIVTPAVVTIAERGLYAAEEEKRHFIALASAHLANLERFVGFAPSYLLHGMSIRYWDGFWFGKRRRFGDTFPHHLSVLTARAYLAYARLTGDKEAVGKAEDILRSCLCLVSDDGRGSAARLHPYTLDGKAGEFFDEFANDQDLVLYDAMNADDLIDGFRV